MHQTFLDALPQIDRPKTILPPAPGGNELAPPRSSGTPD
jgi:hypothetical protein